MSERFEQPEGAGNYDWNGERTQPTTTEAMSTAAERERLHSHLRPRLRELGISLFAAIVALSLLWVGLAVQSSPATRQQEINAAVARALASITPPPPAAVGVYEQIRPSLVQVLAHMSDDTGNEELSYGTGFIINDNGMILTSLHIVAGSKDIDVTFADGTPSKAVLSKIMSDQDLAFLSPIDPPPQITAAVLGNPHQLKVGDQAIVVGNPMRLTGSLSTGAISGLEREFEPPNGSPPMKGLIQIDAAVNPGNSGGPLLNRNGEVVGVIMGRASPKSGEGFIDIGFAVPIDVAISTGGPPPY